MSAPMLGPVIDRSGTITTGGTAQVAASARAYRRYLLIQNTDNAEALWFNFTTTAVQDSPSIKLVANGSFVMESGFISTEAISVIAATTGHKFTIKEA